MSLARLVLVAAFLVGASSVWADEPVAAKPGYTYFNKPNATMQALADDLSDCVTTVYAGSNSGKPILVIVPGFVPFLAANVAMDAWYKGTHTPRLLDINIESCMVLRGWRVVRLDKAEGTKLANLERPKLIETLAPWVGAETPYGEIVRSAVNVAGYPNGAEAKANGDARSLSSMAFDLTEAARKSAPIHSDMNFSGQRYAKPGAAEDLKATDRSAVVILRIQADPAKKLQSITLQRLPAGPAQSAWDEDHLADKLTVTVSPTMQQTVLASVPPGRWIVSSFINTQTCLAAPVVELRANDVVYLGDFDFTTGKVGLDADAVKPDLAPAPDLSGRLKTARWTNGFRHPCTGLYLSGFLVDGVPFASDYPWPGLASGSTSSPQ